MALDAKQSRGSLIVEGITFTDDALAFLLRHKTPRYGIELGDADHVLRMCEDQVYRARKQLSCIRAVLKQHRPMHILDIGCGLALVDVMIAQQVGVAAIHLMDGDGKSPVYTGYNEEAKPAWNSVMIAADMVKQNVDPEVRVTGHMANPSITVACDAIISFKSWGVHYPISTYLPLAKRSLKKGGVICADVEPETDGERMLTQAGFKVVQRIGLRMLVLIKE